MEVFKKLHAAGRTVLTVTHDMRLVAEYAERTVVMGMGQVLLDDTTNNVFKQVEVLQSTHLRPPQITRLGFLLGMADTILTVQEMKAVLDPQTARTAAPAS